MKRDCPTCDGKGKRIYSCCGYDITDYDIMMYKINENLEDDTLYPGNYTYDSLCPYQIQSGEIDISDCLIITDVGEAPTPPQYFASLNTVLIKAFPNPADGNEITFELKNTEHHQNMELRCFNILGELLYKEKIYQHQGKSTININNWNSGMYLALVIHDGQPVGDCKFVVQ